LCTFKACLAERVPKEITENGAKEVKEENAGKQDLLEQL